MHYWGEYRTGDSANAFHVIAPKKSDNEGLRQLQDPQGQV
jgi:hypothetical protein